MARSEPIDRSSAHLEFLSRVVAFGATTCFYLPIENTKGIEMNNTNGPVADVYDAMGDRVIDKANIDVLAAPGHTSAEVATWTVAQAIAYMAVQIRDGYRPDIAAKCTDACAAVAELVTAFRATSHALESQINDPNASLEDGLAAATFARAALARIEGAA